MKLDQPLVSCVIPVYNAEKYLHRCIDSVLSQDYHSLEIILIDDGSTDNSSSICDKYAAAYNNVLVKHISNGGASLARKVGIELAKGEYLTFVDADDYVAKNYVSVMYEALRKYDVNISSCRQQIIRNCVTIHLSQSFDFQLLMDENLMIRFFEYEFWGMPASLYHNSVFKSIEFPKATLSEDYYIKCQMFLQDCKMAYVDAPSYIYEKHEESLSNTKLSIRAFEEFENVHHVYELTKKQMPQYTSLALKNVIETCVKLLLMSRYSERKLYTEQYKSIKLFLKSKTMDIIHNKYLLTNVKLVAIALRFFPFMSSIFNRL